MRVFSKNIEDWKSDVGNGISVKSDGVSKNVRLVVGIILLFLLVLALRPIIAYALMHIDSNFNLTSGTYTRAQNVSQSVLSDWVVLSTICILLIVKKFKVENPSFEMIKNEFSKNIYSWKINNIVDISTGDHK